MVTIIIAYAAGVPEILDVCLASIERHKAGVPYFLKIVTDAHGYIEATGEASKYPLLLPEVIAYTIGDYKTGSEMHGKLLDAAVKDCDTEFILTLDSDCFPVADNWLGHLMALHNQGTFVTGIIWPWIQPPTDLDRTTIEYKLRKYQCYDCTQVACQFIRRDFLVDNHVSFLGSRDTGFSVIDKVWEKGLTVGGLPPSRCPMPKEGVDPELNRMCCVVYGDMIYHQGAATRSVTTGDVDPQRWLEKARQRVLKEKGAEWILKPENSYVYKFDKEEAVAQFKMEGMFNSMRTYLLTHDRLFEPEWGFH
jgi:hypothetical protein